MKRILYLGIIALLASCSSAKYAANFQKSGPGYGYGELVMPSKTTVPTIAEPSNLVASTSKEATILPANLTTEQTSAIEDLRTNYQQLNTREKKEFRKELKSQLKSLVKAKRKGIESTTTVKKTKMLDHDLKLAAIFGAIGVVALIISGNVFYIIGGIALIIGVVFFVMWLVRQ